MSDNNLVDFGSKRKKNVEQKKRQFERVLLNNFLGCYSVLDQNGTIYPVSLVDISQDGCMFQVPHTKNGDNMFKAETEITLRLYFTKDSYIPAVVKIKYGHEHFEKGTEFVRYGCQFDQSVPSFSALKSFVEFISHFAEYSCVDKGDAKVYFL
jgi:hypothetical protein